VRIEGGIRRLSESAALHWSRSSAGRLAVRCDQPISLATLQIAIALEKSRLSFGSQPGRWEVEQLNSCLVGISGIVSDRDAWRVQAGREAVDFRSPILAAFRIVGA
jgi:hypothetical protein